MTSIILTTFLAVVVWASVSCTGADESTDKQVVPESPLLGDLEDIRFLLWTRSNPGDRDYYRLLPEDLDNLNHSPLNTSLPTYIIYHGFNDNGECDWILNSKTGIFASNFSPIMANIEMKERNCLKLKTALLLAISDIASVIWVINRVQSQSNH